MLIRNMIVGSHFCTLRKFIVFFNTGNKNYHISVKKNSELCSFKLFNMIKNMGLCFKLTFLWKSFEKSSNKLELKAAKQNKIIIYKDKTFRNKLKDLQRHTTSGIFLKKIFQHNLT